MRPPIQPTITPAQRQSVVVVGGGFAGLNLIQHLRDAPVNIVLVDRFTLSSTTTRPTNIPRCKNGWPGIPRWTFHFTPTSASWLNAVEGFFAKLTRRRLKRGVFRSVADLQAAINRFVEETKVGLPVQPTSETPNCGSDENNLSVFGERG
jgi:cation diffusion facilitator CzcD-associated flavoprotein CzcO